MNVPKVCALLYVTKRGKDYKTKTLVRLRCNMMLYEAMMLYNPVIVIRCEFCGEHRLLPIGRASRFIPLFRRIPNSFSVGFKIKNVPQQKKEWHL